MLKNSGTQEKGKITYQEYANDAVKFISCGKIKNLIFQKNILFLAISKLRLSTYQCTPSGNPKLKFWLSLPIPKLFPYPLNNVGMLKNSGTQEKGKITYQEYANDAVKFISCGKIKNLIFQKNILFLAIPLKKGCLNLATARQGSIALLNIFFANFSVKKGSKSDRITRFFALNFIKKYCLQGAEQF